MKNSPSALFIIYLDFVYPRVLTNFVNCDLIFAALFLCQLFLLAKRSTMLMTLGRNFSASDFTVISRKFLIAVRVDFL